MRWPVVAPILVVVGLVSAASAFARTPEETVRGMVRAINERDWDALSEYVAPDVRRTSGATPELKVESLAEFEAFLRQDVASCPDAVQEVVRIFSSGEWVAVDAVYRGTQTGAMGSFPPSGRKLELPFLGLLRVRDGKVAEIRVEWDNVNALTQLGHFPPPGAAAGAGAGDPPVRNAVVPAACGQCRFGMEGEGCTLAVKIDGTAYYVEGTGIDDHGDAHAEDGFCEAVRQAEVSGRIEDGKFHASAFRLLPEDGAEDVTGAK